MIQKKASTT